MCDQTETEYLDGDVVWVKLGSCWWPGEVVGPDKLPPDVLPSFRKPPIAVVKFFQESTYEYVKNTNSIYKYNCSKKNEFINKGLYMYRTNKNGHMEKFPEDVIRAETAVGGDIEILTRDEFQEQKKESYAGLFGDNAKKTPASAKRGRGRGRPAAESSMSTPSRKLFKEKSDYKVHILVQPSKEQSTPRKDSEKDSASTPSTSRAGSEVADDKPKPAEPSSATVSTPAASVSGTYTCPNCSFSTTRLNVLILHNKTHSVTYTPYTPSPVRKKPSPKSVAKSTLKTTKSTKTPRPRKEKTEKAPKKPAQSKKRVAENVAENETKKLKTDAEIKSSLLADWDDDADEESNDDTGLLISRSPELPVGSESPAAPTSAEHTGAVTRELSSPEKRCEDTISEKPEASSSDSKYEFCEDEDWPVEADGGRKIPRVKNPCKRKEDTKSLSLDEDEVAKEVAELLNKTAVPELPSVPEPLKVEENFPEPTVVKSPDKNAQEPKNSSENAPIEHRPTKAIFKTKTFFRSRHSRSQDAIGKYVAEQLNHERLDILDSDLNGSEVVSSPEARESPSIDHVKVARLAPKIQLKKMKAEAAQLEREKSGRLDMFEDSKLENMDTTEHTEKTEISLPVKPTQDVIYPTQEIKPINKEQLGKINYREDNKLAADKVEKVFDEVYVSNEIKKDEKDKKPSQDISNEILNKTNTSSVKNTNILSLHEFSLESFDEPLNGSNIITENSKPMFSETYNKKSNRKTKLINKIDNNDPNELTTQKPQDSFDAVSKVAEDLTAAPTTSPNTVASEQTFLNSNEDVIEPEKINQTDNTFSQISSASTDKVSSPVKAINVKTSSNLQKTYEQLMQPYMSESTASAVDALLSVSRETDRVPRIVGSGPPEDLFEDDNKDVINDEGMCIVSKDNGVNEDHIIEEKVNTPVQDLNGIANNETHENIVCTDENTMQTVWNDTKIAMETKDADNQEIVTDHEPSESDLQIAETLINLPSTAIQNKANEQPDVVSTPMSIDAQPFEETVIESENIVETDAKSYDIEETVSTTEITNEIEINNDDNLNTRFETEQEKSENLNAAQSLVQMSESIDHKMNVLENNTFKSKESSPEIKNNGTDTSASVEQKIQLLSSDNNSDPTSNDINRSPKYETTSSKLLKILEEPTTAKPTISKSTIIKQTTPVKQVLEKVVITGKEKILNFDVAKAALKSKTETPKQKIIIRRTGTGKTFLNNLADVVTSPDKIILSRTNVSSQDGSSVQTFTIQQAPPETSAASDANTNKQIIIQPKVRKITKTPTKLQKIKPQQSLVQWNETKTNQNQSIVSDDTMFDINSMPVVLSDDILTPENIEKMPIVMSDGNLMNKTTTQQNIIHSPKNPPKLIKSKPTIIENEKVAISASPSKSEVKTLLINEASKVSSTPNILSKSGKLRGAKPMLVIDKATGKQKIIMTKSEPTIKETKTTPTIIQPAPQQAPKTEKFIILPTGSSQRTGRQKIVIDPQTGKAHMLVAKGQETPAISVPDNKPVSAKLIPSVSDSSSPGNTVMIITNAQGTQSRIVLTPEHEKILFPNKPQPNVSQLKTITQRISANASLAQKTVISATSSLKTPTKIVPKQQKSAIITSKGQLIVGGRVTSTAQNIAPMPEIRPAPKPEIRTVPKRIVASEPKKLVQAIQKTTSEPLIFLQQKSGAVMQLTAAQFEHLQRTGQIVQKAPPPEKQIVVQKSITINPKETVVSTPQKTRVRKSTASSSIPAKKAKQQPEIAIAPSPLQPAPPVPPLTSLSSTVPAATATNLTIVPSASNTISVSTSSSYPDLENFEELLPSTAIVKQLEPPAPPVVPQMQPQLVVEPVPPLPPQPEPVVEPPQQLSEGQLLAVPGENFGGPPGSFYLCVGDNGTLTPIDNRPLVLEDNQLVPMAVESFPVFAPQPERQDILQAALANSDVFHAEATRDEAPDFRDLNANVSVHCRVSETSTTLNQPIMTPVEVPTEGDSKPTLPANLEDGLAAIGVTPHSIPTTLELPITVTDPRIAPKTTDPLSNSNYGAALLTSPNTDMPFIGTEEPEAVGPMSMPLLTETEESGLAGKSMPILTEEPPERGASSVESGSPCSLETEAEGGRLLTPATDLSDVSEASAEIPLQPRIQHSRADFASSAHS